MAYTKSQEKKYVCCKSLLYSVLLPERPILLCNMMIGCLTADYLEKLLGARLGTVVGDDGGEVTLQNRLGTLVRKCGGEDEDLTLLLHVLRLQRGWLLVDIAGQRLHPVLRQP